MVVAHAPADLSYVEPARQYEGVDYDVDTDEEWNENEGADVSATGAGGRHHWARPHWPEASKTRAKGY